MNTEWELPWREDVQGLIKEAPNSDHLFLPHKQKCARSYQYALWEWIMTCPLHKLLSDSP